MADTGIGITESFRICKSELCSGCGACVNVCPKNCIQFEEDRYGQERPVIDQKHCLECNICRKICPNNKKKKVYRTDIPSWFMLAGERKRLRGKQVLPVV